MAIEWSDEDQAYLVSFPEWAEYVAQPVTHGDTYEEAAHKGKEVLENLVAGAQLEGVPLPTPRTQVAT
jgi:predicted RNase H-like HicB family nuclease